MAGRPMGKRKSNHQCRLLAIKYNSWQLGLLPPHAGERCAVGACDFAMLGGKREIKMKALEESAKRLEVKREQEPKYRKDEMKNKQIVWREHGEKHKQSEEVEKQQKKCDQKLSAKKEAKEQRRPALVECKLNRNETKVKLKKQRCVEKEKETAGCKQRIGEDANSNISASKDAKHMDELLQHNETTIQAQKTYVQKVSGMLASCPKGSHKTKGQSMLGINSSNISIETYELSPHEEEISNEDSRSDEDNNDDVTPGKIIPQWARKENLIPHILSQQYIDPDGIFIGTRTLNLNEVFESNGSNRMGDFKRRSYSGEWLNDCFTLEEEILYKLQMGYIN